MKKIEVQAADGVLKPSSLVMGAAHFGASIEKNMAFELLDRYRELGGNTIDTARSCAGWLPGGDSASERAVGEYIWSRGCREQILVITKGCRHQNSDFSDNRLTPEVLIAEFNRSYELLGIDTIDIYLLHRDHPKAPLPQILETLHSFIEEGRVRALGVANWRFDRILEANDYAAQHGLTPFTVSGVHWSLAECTSRSLGDQTVVCMTDSEFKKYYENGLPLLAYSPQAEGLFSGLANAGADTLDEGAYSRFCAGNTIQRAKRTLEIANERGAPPEAVALSYILNNALQAAAVMQCGSVPQLEQCMAAAGLTLEPDIIEYLMG